MPHRRTFTAALFATTAATVAACGIHARDKQQYAGALTSRQPDCPATTGTLVVQEGKAVFSPGDGTWLLTGTAASGHVLATQSRPGFDHKTYTTTLETALDDRAAHGTYTTPSCVYEVSLTRF